jgi:hypothetical protein
MGDMSFKLDIDIDWKYWVLFPALNLNFRTGRLEFEFLCFGFYLNRMYSQV